MTAGILTGLRVKKETVGEIAAAATVMRDLSVRCRCRHATLVDTCGTGGDGAHTFNISTASMFVAAAAGARWPSTAGAAFVQVRQADVLEALGVNVNMHAEQVATCIAATGIGFMFAPNHHSAMKHAAPVRREMGVRTLFNILGPLTNPAGAPNPDGRVPSRSGRHLVRVLQRTRRSQHVLVVHGRDGHGRDVARGATLVGELRDGEVREYEFHPGRLRPDR
jgi:anthranilate phosphoribosyltransferase